MTSQTKSPWTGRAVAQTFFALLALLLLAVAAPRASAEQRREREPNSVYAERRAKLAAQVDGPIVLFGFTNREEAAQTYVFAQEENFYYLTGHNEEGAALLLLPATGSSPRETLYLPAKDADKEKWNGERLSPTDPDIAGKTGFAAVKPFTELHGDVEKLAAGYAHLYTILPYERENGGYPHEQEWTSWLQAAAPKAKLGDVRALIGKMRQIKSPGEMAFLTKAIELSLDAHFEAMRMMRPGLFEYQIAARMEEVHAMGGSEAEGYAPIVGAGFNSTVLHYDKLAKRIEPGDIVVLDVAAQYSGHSADITRTLPADGKYTPRQREIYDIVLGAQDAALAACKPGMTFARDGSNSLRRIAYEYINSHGKDRNGDRLGKYFIHGLGHHIGLDVHDAGPSFGLFEPGMVVTLEPGIYIPEESLGVRIEDDVLVTATGCTLLSARLPRRADEIEKIMAAAAKERAARGN
jgi:Xaa-Pro aminopeptidase